MQLSRNLVAPLRNKFHEALHSVTSLIKFYYNALKFFCSVAVIVARCTRVELVSTSLDECCNEKFVQDMFILAVLQLAVFRAACVQQKLRNRKEEFA